MGDMATRLTSPVLALGLDFGTSGARVAVVNPTREVLFQASAPYPAGLETASAGWGHSLEALLTSVPYALRQQVGAITCDGTSSTVLLCQGDGTPLVPPLMYSDSQGADMVPLIEAMAPPHHPVLSATSTLAKVLWWRHNLPSELWIQAAAILHQADWLLYQLHGQLGHSDYHNTLKLGYDPQNLTYPSWILDLGIAPLLPQVWAPGTPVGPLLPRWVHQLHFPSHCQVCAGTTDSNAAVLASGAHQPGDAVTSLGSTLVLKLISDQYVADGRRGVYSHRLGNRWLVSGASNTGGAVLAHYFTSEELTHLSRAIDPTQPSPLNYYPLLRPGERFPTNDPYLLPRLSPRPQQQHDFLHGLLDGIARIEQAGYSCLHSLGAPTVGRIFTAGGGAQNSTWTTIRKRYLACPIEPAHQVQAAVGTAYLAQRSA